MSQTIPSFVVPNRAVKPLSVPAIAERPEQLKPATGLVLGMGLSLAAWIIVGLGTVIYYLS